MKAKALILGLFLALTCAVPSSALLFSGAPLPNSTIPLTVYNSSGSPITNAPVSFEQPFALADMPSGSHAVMYDGDTPLTTQQDSCSRWLSDGSCKSTQISFVPASITGSGNHAYTVKAVSGVPSTTPNISTAQATGNTNICVKTSDLQRADGTAETGTWRLACLNDIIANYSQFNSVTGYGSNPTGGWEYYSKGPVKIGIHAWQFAKRESDSAIHKWLRTDLWVDMRGSGTTPCPCSIAVWTGEPNIYGPVAAGTIGNTVETAYNFSSTVYNGANVIHVFGGASDTRTATIANANFNTSTSTIDISGTWMTAVYGSGPVSFTCATTCPGGITAGVDYWPSAVDATHVQLYLYQCMLGATCVSTTVAPITITSQGSGTITMVPYAFSNPYSGLMYLDNNADRMWISAAGTVTTAPTILVGQGFSYLTQKSKAVPPYIVALGGNLVDYASGHSIYDYYPGSYQYPLDMNTTGDTPGDERIGYIDHTGAYSLFNPADAGAAKASRSIAASLARTHMYNIDETSGQPVVFNNGHARNGVTYAAMGAVQPSSRTYPYQSGTWMSPYTGDVDLDFIYERYSARIDASHLPVPFQAPMIKSGNPEWEFLMVNLTNANLGNYSVPNNNMGGTVYARVMSQNNQTRGVGWGMRALGQAVQFARDDNPATPYLRDVLSDQPAWMLAVNTYYLDPAAQTLGFSYSDMNSGQNLIQPWMDDFLYEGLGMEAWRNEYPNFVSAEQYAAKFVVGRMDAAGSTGGGGCLWAGASRYLNPYTNDTAGDWANTEQTFNAGMYSHTSDVRYTSGDGWGVAKGGPRPYTCPGSGLYNDSPGSGGYQGSSLISISAVSAAMGAILSVPHSQTIYDAIRNDQYNNGCDTCSPAMSFITYNNSGKTISLPEFAWGYLGATQ